MTKPSSGASFQRITILPFGHIPLKSASNLQKPKLQASDLFYEPNVEDLRLDYNHVSFFTETSAQNFHVIKQFCVNLQIVFYCFFLLSLGKPLT